MSIETIIPIIGSAIAFVIGWIIGSSLPNKEINDLRIARLMDCRTITEMLNEMQTLTKEVTEAKKFVPRRCVRCKRFLSPDNHTEHCPKCAGLPKKEV